MNKTNKNSIARVDLSDWQWALIIIFILLSFYLIWIWQGFDVTDEGFNLTNQWLLVNFPSHYSWDGMPASIWLSNLTGGIWLKISGGLGLIGARLGWVILNTLTGLVSFLILKRYFNPVYSLLAVIATAFAINYHGTLTINYNNFPVLLLVSSSGLLLISQDEEISFRQMRTGFAVIGGVLLGLGVMARFPLVLSLFLPFVPPISHTLITRRWPHKPDWIKPFVSFASAFVTIFICLSFLYFTNHLRDYIWGIRDTLSKSGQTPHSIINFLHRCLDTLKPAILKGSTVIISGIVIATGIVLTLYLIRIFRKKFQEKRLITLVGVLVGSLMIIASFVIISPSFIADYLSPDGVLERTTLLRIHITSLGVRAGGSLLVVVGGLTFVFEGIYKQLRRVWQKRQWIAAVFFGFLFFGVIYFQVGDRVTYSLALPGVYLLLAILQLFLIMSFSDSTSEQQVRRYVLLNMALFIPILKMIGSNNGIPSANDAMWLLFPANFLLLPESIGMVGYHLSRKSSYIQSVDKIPGNREVVKYIVVAMIAISLVGFSIRLNNPYRDLSNRFQLTTPLESKRLSGIFTSSGRSSSINSLLKEVDRLVQHGDSVLAYSSIPMIHYVTRTIPALKNPWPTLMQPSKLETKLRELHEDQRSPKYIIKTRTNTRKRTWGTRNIDLSSAPLLTVKDIEILNSWIKENSYVRIWNNSDFSIYKVPYASK